MKLNDSNKKRPILFGLFKWWEVGDKILTNYAYDVYEMSPYLIEMKSWLVELDEQKKDKERPIII